MRFAPLLIALLALAACKDRGEPSPAELDVRASAEASALASSEASTAPGTGSDAAAAATSVPPPVSLPAHSSAKAAAATAPLPADVSRLVERIEACEHFAGEDPYDEERGKFLREQIEATCPGNKAELARLRGRYAKDPGVSKRLSALEPPDM